MENVVIVGGSRTPIGSFGGTLRAVPVYRIAAYALNEAVNKAGVEPEQVYAELRRREGTSGIAEKAARPKS